MAPRSETRIYTADKDGVLGVINRVHADRHADLDAIAKNTVEKRLGNKQLIPGIGHGIHTQGDPRAERLFREVTDEESFQEGSKRFAIQPWIES